MSTADHSEPTSRELNLRQDLPLHEEVEGSLEAPRVDPPPQVSHAHAWDGSWR